MGIEVNKQRTTLVVGKALEAMDNRQKLFSEGIFRPEENYIEMLKEFGELVGKSEFAANSIFLTTAFVFGDDTGKLFNRISNVDRLAKYSWIFEPRVVLKMSDQEIITGCAEFFRPAGYNKSVVLAWPYNLRILKEKYIGDIRNFFNQYGGDVDKITEALTVRPRAKTKEKKQQETFIRYGPKIANLLIQWMDQYDLYKFESLDGGKIPVDFQLARILIQTDGLILDKPENAYQVTSAVGRTLGFVSNEQEWQLRRISEALWNIGNQGCNNKRHGDCPLQEECGRLISRKPYDKDGKFDPKDVGRWE